MIVKIWVRTNIQGSKVCDEVEVDDDEIKGLSDEDAGEYINAIAWKFAQEMIEWGWEIK